MKRFATFIFALALAATGPLAAQTTVEHIHTDALGSVVAVTDANRNVIDRREFAPYGDQLNAPAADRGPGYTGHVEDGLTGLTYMQQRYDDPAIGRFLSVDPVGPLEDPLKHFGRYHYANNNPYKYTDPDGEAPHIAVGALVGAAFGGGMEALRQVRAGKDIDLGDIGTEAFKGGVVGALTAALPGAAVALTSNRALQVAAVTTGATGVAAGGEVVAQVAKGDSIDLGSAAVAGVANAAGVGAGQLVSGSARWIASSGAPANAGLPVTSHAGRVFRIGATPSTESTNEVVQQGLQDFSSSAVSSAIEDSAKRR